MKHLSSLSYPIISILLGGLVIRTIIAIFLPAGYDEAYYYIYTQNLDWSYFDHPVLVSLTTGIGVWLTGEVNQFTIRIGTLIIYTASLYLLYLTGKNFFGAKSGLFTLIIASVIPIFTVAFGVLTLPDTPLIFFWTLTLYLTGKEFFISPDDNKYKPSYRIILISFTIALSCLGKYHGFILGMGLVGFCLFNQPYRKVFFSHWLLIGFIIFCFTLFPIFFWNLQNDWASFSFQLSGRFQSENPTPLNFNVVNILVVALVGIAYLFPTFGFPLWWVSGKTFYGENTTGINYKYRLILWVSLPLTLGFTFLGGFTQILPTWPMPGFWGLTLILGDFTHNWFKCNPKLIKRSIFLSFLFINTVCAIALLHINMGILQKPNQIAFFQGLVAPQNDPSTELIDIVQLRREFNASPALMKALEKADFIFTNEYYLGGYFAMAIHSIADIPVTCISNDCRGFNYWYPRKGDLIDRKGLFITSKRFMNNNTSGKAFEEYFQQWQKVTEIPLKRGGEITETIIIYLGENYRC